MDKQIYLTARPIGISDVHQKYNNNGKQVNAVDEQLLIMLSIVQNSGLFAPILFILFHVLRQFMFIPVAFVCMAGGVMFGSVLGTLYSMIGLLLLSAVFYFGFRKLPGTYHQLMKIKYKWFGSHKMTIGQIAVVRLVPFIHYQLLNICLLEREPHFRGFMKGALITNLPLAFFYTVFGEFITRFSPAIIGVIIILLIVLFYLLREKVVTVKWEKFFSHSSV